MKKIIAILLLGASFVYGDIYLQGSKNFGVSVGSGSVNVGRASNSYTIVGVSGNYFVVDNLSVGLGIRAWFGASPSLEEVSIPVTYFIPLDEKFRPYFGVFGRHTFVESPLEDYNAFGGRLGLAVKLSDNAYMSVGWVQEYYDKDVFGSNNTNGYPEVAIGIAF